MRKNIENNLFKIKYMKGITHEDVKKMVFASSPEVKKYYDEEILNEKISLQIKEIRNKKRITQLELAKKADTTQSIIARIESWKQNISMKTLQKILSALWATIKLELQES